MGQRGKVLLTRTLLVADDNTAYLPTHGHQELPKTSERPEDNPASADDSHE